MRERAVPAVRVVRTGALRAALVTTSLWQRGGCNNVAVTSTWLGAATGAGAAGPVWERQGRCGAGGTGAADETG